MKLKNFKTVLLLALILTSCAPALTGKSPTKTAVPISSSTPIPLTTKVSPTATAVPISTITPIPLVDTVTSTLPPGTSEPTSALSAEGPWLVYLHNSPRMGYADLLPVAAEFIILNQDGSGRTSITLPECDNNVNAFLMEGGNSDNYMIQHDGGLYLFRPSQSSGMVIYRQVGSSICHTYFIGDDNGGLLASFYQAANDVSPELIIYELPGGKIRERFSLVRCPEGVEICEDFRSRWGGMMEQQPQWSPNGRYLAFAALLDAPTSDLFVYDTQNGDLRRLTNGPDWVGPIEWSPDGNQIIMQELLNDIEYFFYPHSKPPTSVWSVSVSTGEINFLYSTGNAYAMQNILFWLDDKRFIAHEGFVWRALEAARNLRLVDMEAGTDRVLFDVEFVQERFDPVHEVFALYVLQQDKYPQGIYLVSMNSGDIRRLDDYPIIRSFPDWDKNAGLFVTSDDCENDLQSLQAFDHQGNFKCVPKSTPTPAPLAITSFPAPNGKWSVSVQDGLWLETDDKPSVPVSRETASDVIWCPDSSCFFFSVLQQNQQWTLYHASLPDLTIRMVDEGIESTGSYQWLKAKSNGFHP